MMANVRHGGRFRVRVVVRVRVMQVQNHLACIGVTVTSNHLKLYAVLQDPCLLKQIRDQAATFIKGTRCLGSDELVYKKRL